MVTQEEVALLIPAQDIVVIVSLRDGFLLPGGLRSRQHTLRPHQQYLGPGD